ncbi:hypothetical protein KSF_089190 [Reticulibacter mediterranei]|uniref:TIR domain-containing protein n=1 Tax=Reticulibacter mediterranei TaxID=2778369 RepID=A0A8J3J129_9CHLR|nr:toll/interleukin-1 receptor domain-containing protein [Reticulibacter mediterranei]GHO98871.1 hypothetical protein KSF_089190 [Reticulibacter mediterranei]
MALKIFYCYAHEDQAFRNELEKHLSPLKRLGRIIDWCDREIQPGADWKQDIDTHLNDADMVLLLVSPGFMASEYCYSVEMQRAITRHQTEGVHILPIILRPVHWEETILGSLQALPTGAKPITTWRRRDDAYWDVVNGITKVVKTLLAQQHRDEGCEHHSVVEASGERRESISVSPTKEPALLSTHPQQHRVPQPSTHTKKNREYAERWGWEYVTYETQRGVGNALLSRHLGPSDVEACPQLPEVATVLEHLRVTSSAIIKGDSGSGKTITAYQAAYVLHKQGWQVFRLAEPHHATNELIDGISYLPQRAILLLDNAQSLDPGFVRHSLERSTDNLAVLVVSTDDVVHPLDAITIANERAVAVLAQDARRRKKEFLPIVQTLNQRHVGEGFLDIPLERLVEEAEKSKTPWQFNFVLTGGERYANNSLAALREVGRADLLLAIIAAGQIVTLDEGVSGTWLKQAVQSLGRNQFWLEESLRALHELRVIFGKHYYRCSHLRFSMYVLRIICNQSGDAEWNNLTTTLSEILTWQSTPLRGISWLLNELRFYDIFAYQQRYNAVVTSSNWQQIFERCWRATSDEERRDAAFALDALIDWYPPHREAIVEKAPLLVQWIEQAGDRASFSIGTLLNSLGQGRDDAKQMTEAMCEQIDPHLIAMKLSQVKWTEVVGWSHLVGRLSWAASKKWYKQFEQIADFSFIESLVDTMTTTDIYAFSELLKNICGYHPEKFLGVYRRAIPTLVDAFHVNVTEAYSEARDGIWYILGYGIFRRRAPSVSQQRVAKKFVDALQPQIIAKALSHAPQRDWSTWADLLSFIKQASPKHAVKIAELIDFAQLDESAQGLWQQTPHELLQLILSLSILPDCNPARSWVMHHAGELGEMSVVLAYVTPQIVVEKLRTGNNLPLRLFWPELTTLALHAIATIDNSLAIQIVESSISKIADELSGLAPYNCKGVARLLKYLHGLSPTTFGAIIKEVDPEKARESWGQCLQEKAESKKTIALIFALSQSVEGPISEVIKQLKAKYPKASVA